MTQVPNIVFVNLTGNPLSDAPVIADALARSAAPLFNVNGGLYTVADGALVGVGGAVLRDIAVRYLATKTAVCRNGKWEVEHGPVELDGRLQRCLINGIDPRSGEEIRGGRLLSRLPAISETAPA
jgi:hypothetical protein